MSNFIKNIAYAFLALIVGYILWLVAKKFTANSANSSGGNSGGGNYGNGSLPSDTLAGSIVGGTKALGSALIGSDVDSPPVLDWNNDPNEPLTYSTVTPGVFWTPALNASSSNLETTMESGGW